MFLPAPGAASAKIHSVGWSAGGGVATAMLLHHSTMPAGLIRMGAPHATITSAHLVCSGHNPTELAHVARMGRSRVHLFHANDDRACPIDVESTALLLQEVATPVSP